MSDNKEELQDFMNYVDEVFLAEEERRRETMAKRSDVFRAIDVERDYQDEEWGSPASNPHTIFEWIGIMRKELQEAEDAFFNRPADELMLQEVLQVVAVGVACMEQHGIVHEKR